MIYTANKGQDIYGAPRGIIVMDCLIPHLPGTPGNAQSFDHPVFHEVVRGADMQNLIYDPMPDLVDKFIEAGRRLVQQGAKTVIGNCGFMVLFLREMAAALPVPVLMSGLLQLPLIRHGLQPEQSMGIVSASGASLTPRHMEIACWGMLVPVNIRGLEDKPAFRTAIHNQVALSIFQRSRPRWSRPRWPSKLRTSTRARSCSNAPIYPLRRGGSARHRAASL